MNFFTKSTLAALLLSVWVPGTTHAAQVDSFSNAAVSSNRFATITYDYLSAGDARLTTYSALDMKSAQVAIGANNITVTITLGGISQFMTPATDEFWAYNLQIDVNGDGFSFIPGSPDITAGISFDASNGKKLYTASNWDSNGQSTQSTNIDASSYFQVNGNTLTFNIPKTFATSLSSVSTTSQVRINSTRLVPSTQTSLVYRGYGYTSTERPVTATPTPSNPQASNYGPPYRVTFTNYCDVYEMNHVTPGSTVLYGRNIASGCESDAFIAGEIVAGTNPVQVVLTGGYASSGPAEAVKVISMTANNGYGGSFSAYGAKKGAARNGVEVTKSISGNWSLSPISGGAGGSFSSNEKMPSLKSVLGQ